MLLTLAPAPLTACQVPALLNATRSAVAVASSPEVQSRVQTVAGVGAQVADGVGMTASQVKVQVSTSCWSGAHLGRAGKSACGERHQSRQWHCASCPWCKICNSFDASKVEFLNNFHFLFAPGHHRVHRPTSAYRWLCLCLCRGQRWADPEGGSSNFTLQELNQLNFRLSKHSRGPWVVIWSVMTWQIHRFDIFLLAFSLTYNKPFWKLYPNGSWLRLLIKWTLPRRRQSVKRSTAKSLKRRMIMTTEDSLLYIDSTFHRGI